MFDVLLIRFPASGVETYLLFPPLVAFCISFLTSMGGVSGAFLLLPFQMSVLGFTAPSVSATNFLYNVVGTPGGVYGYVREGRMAWNLAGTLTGGLVPGILVGYYLRVIYLPDPTVFKAFVGLVLIYLGVRMLAGLRQRGADQRSPMRNPSAVSERGVVPALAFPRWPMLAVAFGVGIVGGVYGIGGGAVVAPFCIAVFGLPVHRIAGAVLFATLTSSVAGVAFYSLVPVQGQVWPPDWVLGALLGIGGLVGSYAGARSQKHVPAKWIHVILGLILLTVALRYLGQFLLA